MEVLEASKLHKEMETFCSYKLRTFLSFDGVDDLTSQVLMTPEESVGEVIKVSISLISPPSFLRLTQASGPRGCGTR